MAPASAPPRLFLANWLGVITVRKVNGKPKHERLVIDPGWTELSSDLGAWG